jgi:hypothetical protein
MGSSRIRHFLLMLPFFLVGIAIPVFLYGFSGDGPPDLTPERYSPVTRFAPAPAPVVPPEGGGSGQYAPSPDGGQYAAARKAPAVVTFMRALFEGFVDRYISQSLSPATIKLGAFAIMFSLSFLLVRLLLAVIRGAAGNVVTFLVHKAAAPMFMGFLAVGSTWGIHQTIAEEFGMSWAATTVTLTAAIASLFALAGVKIR